MKPVNRTTAGTARDSRAPSAAPSSVGRDLRAAPAKTRKTSYGPIGNRLLKVAVVFLCTVNALMWEFYTESRIMAIVWAAIAVGFIFWIIDDMRR